MFAELPLLSLLIWLPVFGGIAVILAGRNNPTLARVLALLISVLALLLCVPLYQAFDLTSYKLQFVEQIAWLPWLDIHYGLGIDGFALPMILLTSFTTVLVVLAGWEVIKDRPAYYLASFLIMSGLMKGVFAATDAILFYVFWEAMLIPMFLIIGVWGGPRRVYATLKFFLYTFFGSVFMLVALIYLYLKSGSFSIAAFHQQELPLSAQLWIFAAFLIAFAVKVPMWPVHTWLPDAHVEAPTGGSVVLAAIMLKMGTYGFIRFNLPITPDASQYFAPLMIGLSLVAVIYIGMVALVQTDMKKLIAYSSIAHMGFVTLGFFAIFLIDRSNSLDAAILAMQGALVQMLSHGFISAAMFLCVGVLYDRLHSRNIADYGGVVNRMPQFAALFMLFSMANAGLPGTSGFVGEFWVILAVFQANFWIAFGAAMTLIFGAAYSLWMYKRVVFGDIGNSHVAELQDINGRERFILVVLAFMVLLFGLWPQPMTELMDASVSHLLECSIQSKQASLMVGSCS